MKKIGLLHLWHVRCALSYSGGIRKQQDHLD